MLKVSNGDYFSILLYFTKAKENRLYTFANICHLSSYMPQFHFTGSSEFDFLYMALNYSYTGIHGCSSGSQEYCQFSKANEPAFFSFPVSSLRGLFLFVCFWSKSFNYFLWNINILNNNADNFLTLVHFQMELKKIQNRVLGIEGIPLTYTAYEF